MDNFFLVSVVIPVYNREKTITSTLDSVFNQIYRPLEIVIVDDGSSDNSLASIKSWSESNKVNSDSKVAIHILSQINSGAPAARNKGFLYCSGDYTQFLDSDDYLHPKKIYNQVSIMEKNKADLAVCDFQYVDSDGMVTKIVRNTGNLCLSLSKGGSIFTATPLIMRKHYLKKVMWEEKLKRNQDMDFNFKLLLFSKSMQYTPGVWCDYIHHPGEQISDTYSSTSPQFARKISSIIKFSIYNFNDINKKNIIYIIIYIFFLTRASAKFYLVHKVLKFYRKRCKNSFKVI